MYCQSRLLSLTVVVYNRGESVLISHVLRSMITLIVLIMATCSQHFGIKIYHTTGHFSQYDGLIYPETQTASTFYKFKNWITGSGGDIPNHDQVQRDAMIMFLRYHKKALMDYEISTLGFSNFVNDVFQIYKQLFSLNIFCKNKLETYLAQNLHKVRILLFSVDNNYYHK